VTAGGYLPQYVYCRLRAWMGLLGGLLSLRLPGLPSDVIREKHCPSRRTTCGFSRISLPPFRPSLRRFQDFSVCSVAGPPSDAAAGIRVRFTLQVGERLAPSLGSALPFGSRIVASRICAPCFDGLSHSP